MKTCTGPCKRRLPLEAFHRSSKEKDGRRTRCRDCTNATNRKSVVNQTIDQRAKRREYEQRYFQENRLMLNAKSAKWRRDNPEKVKEITRRSELRAKYGITLEKYEAMLASQGGHCACCSATVADSRGYPLHVDHCHETGRIRGLLCANCNTIFGRVSDDPEMLRRLADYLSGPNTTGGSVAAPTIWRYS